MKKRARKYKRQQRALPHRFSVRPFAGSFVLLDLLRTLCGEGVTVQGLYIILPLRLLALPLLFFFWFLAFLYLRPPQTFHHTFYKTPSYFIDGANWKTAAERPEERDPQRFFFCLFCLRQLFPPSKSIYGRRKDNLSTPDDPSNPPPTHPQWGDPICPCTSPPSMVLKMTWYW